MKKKLPTLLLFLSIISFAQINFEKGYFINNQNDTVHCLIKNVEWHHSPSEFEYKKTENSSIEIGDIYSVKEFSIGDVIYQRFEVDIDLSPQTINQLSFNKKPEFSKKILFLKLLIQGKANLYLYNQPNLVYYFFSTKEIPVTPLIYKEYLNSNRDIVKNEQYKQQIWTKLNYDGLTKNDIQYLYYQKAHLVKFFTKYNDSHNTDYINLDKKSKKGDFNLYIKPGIRFSSLSIENPSSPTLVRDTDFKNSTEVSLGIGLEYVLPFNQNKWAIFAEPTYQSFSGEETIPYLNTSTQSVKIDYKSLEIPLGIRHYFFLNKQSKLFLSGALGLDFVMGDKKIHFERSEDLNINSGLNLILGMGYMYNKYLIELKAGTNRNLLGEYINWSSDYQTVAISIGYNLF